MELSAKTVGRTIPRPILVRVTEEEDLPLPLRRHEALFVKGGRVTSGEGFAAVLRIGPPLNGDEVVLPESLSYLRSGDILRLGRDRARVLYRKNSPHNILFMTERCNSRCLMCSQPPKEADDGFLVDEILETLPLMSRETRELCITGGEPTLLHDRLLQVIEAAKYWLPNTGLHMLSNGRLLAYAQYAAKIAAIGHPDFVIGIPVYSDIATRHDFVVQAKGAFDQTVRGILNLGRYKQRVEIRVVLHKQTVDRLVELAAFISTNLPFVSRVAWMGLEMTGYTRSNLDALWIDPLEYQPALTEAVNVLRQARIKTSIYNHQLCILAPALWPYAVRSISDWKNVYMPECEGCAKRGDCGGFFASASLRYSAHIKPFRQAEVAVPVN